MTNEKKIWLCEQCAQKAWGTSQRFAQEAASAGVFGKGYAVVAEEARFLADKLFDYAAKARFEGNDSEFKGVAELAFMTGLLATNASIEILNVEQNSSGRAESMLVLSEDLRNISFGLKNMSLVDIASPAYVSPFVMPEITDPVKSSRKTDWFLRFSVGGVTMVENIANIGEICYLRKEDVSGDTLSLRGYELPLVIIDCGQKKTEHQTVMIIVPEGNRFGSKEGRYAVPVDELDINPIFTSRIGCNVPPKADHPFAGRARECWDVVGGDQLVFLDWHKLTGQKASATPG
jgi:hypothetical protein